MEPGQEESNVKLVELFLALKALDKVRQPNFKLYFYSCVYPIHNKTLMSILVFRTCLFLFRDHIFITLCNCGYTNRMLFCEWFYCHYLNYKKMLSTVIQILNWPKEKMSSVYILSLLVWISSVGFLMQCFLTSLLFQGTYAGVYFKGCCPVCTSITIIHEAIHKTYLSSLKIF